MTMDITILRKYLLDKKEDIKKLDVKKREINVKLTKRFIITIIGPRRSGKTHLMYDLILNRLNLKDDSYVYVNFEDLGMKDAHAEDIISMINLHEEIYGVLPEYLFFDEIQTLEGWEKLIYTLFEKKQFFIVLTGSSSKLLSKELATQLRGRALSILMLPFSFREYLEAKGFQIKNDYASSEENKIKNHLTNYIKLGGFPDVVLEEDVNERFFMDYIDLLLFRDIIERFGIKNISVIRHLIAAALTSYSKEFSVHKNYTVLKSKGIKLSEKTLYSYAELLEDVFFSFYLKKYYFSQRKSRLSTPKVYINDTGLIRGALALRHEDEFGRFMENCVFLELKRMQNKKPSIELYYYKTTDDREVDFVIREGKDVVEMIQVCYNLEDDDTQKRELTVLIKAADTLLCENLLVITWDLEEVKELKGHKIRFIPLWKWLIGA
ncbi:MAG: ATP-binding protein [archaeon]